MLLNHLKTYFKSFEINIIDKVNKIQYSQESNTLLKIRSNEFLRNIYETKFKTNNKVKSIKNLFGCITATI